MLRDTESAFDLSHLRGQTFTVSDAAATMDVAIGLPVEEGSASGTPPRRMRR